MIPMRDGVRLHTVILLPKGAKGAPILLRGRLTMQVNSLPTIRVAESPPPQRLVSTWARRFTGTTMPPR